jgi:hypothetical protein
VSLKRRLARLEAEAALVEGEPRELTLHVSALEVSPGDPILKPARYSRGGRESMTDVVVTVIKVRPAPLVVQGEEPPVTLH